MIADFELKERAMIWIKGRMHRNAKNETTAIAAASKRRSRTKGFV
jgi:hypothetical protein